MPSVQQAGLGIICFDHISPESSGGGLLWALLAYAGVGGQACLRLQLSSRASCTQAFLYHVLANIRSKKSCQGYVPGSCSHLSCKVAFVLTCATLASKGLMQLSVQDS